MTRTGSTKHCRRRALPFPLATGRKAARFSPSTNADAVDWSDWPRFLLTIVVTRYRVEIMIDVVSRIERRRVRVVVRVV